MTSSALPLKVPPVSPAKAPSSTEKVDYKSNALLSKQATASNPSDISSPHELTAFVETLLEQLDNKFDEMSSQILDRMNQMSSRVDALEGAIQDIINGGISTPIGSQSSTPNPGATMQNARKSPSGFSG